MFDRYTQQQQQAPRDEEAERIQWDQRVEEILRPPILLGAAAMLEAATLQTAFLVKDMIPAGAITLILGVPGAKKSWLAYDLALATVQGREWLGAPVTTRGAAPPCALILNYDNPRPECGRRFMRLGMQPDDRIFFHSVDLDPMRLPEHAPELVALVDHLHPSLVVVDSLRQAHVSDENSSQEMGIVMGHLKALYAHGAAVVVVHHSGKGGLTEGVNKARGSGEIPSSADAIIEVSWDKDNEHDVAVWTKHRSWELSVTEESVPFALKDHGALTVLSRL